MGVNYLLDPDELGFWVKDDPSSPYRRVSRMEHDRHMRRIREATEMLWEARFYCLRSRRACRAAAKRLRTRAERRAGRVEAP